MMVQPLVLFAHTLCDGDYVIAAIPLNIIVLACVLGPRESALVHNRPGYLMEWSIEVPVHIVHGQIKCPLADKRTLGQKMEKC